MRALAFVFYYYLWVVLNTFLGYFYRQKRLKHTVGLGNVPKKGPVLICGNHPNAFMDALLLGVTISRPTWSLARGDAFKNKSLAKFLGFLGIIPIYRLQEGAENLSKNDDMIDRCVEVFEEGKPILIYSEGLCVQERRLRPLKKGTARIAFTAEERNDFKLNLIIVPAGLNYSAIPWKFRSRFHIRFGEPFALKDYEELYKKNKATAIKVFTRDLEAKMAELIIVIDDKANDELVFQMEQMFTKKWAEEEGRNPNNQTETHHITKEITHMLKECAVEEPERISLLREKTAAYFNKMKAIKTRDWVIGKNAEGELNYGGVLLNYFLFLLFSPIWIFGLITNYVPYKVPYLIAKKVVERIEWHASVNATTGLFLWQFYWLLQSLVVALVFRNWYLLWAFMLAVPITGALAQELYVLLKRTIGATRFLQAKKSQPQAVEELTKLRNEIVVEVEGLRAKFHLGNE